MLVVKFLLIAASYSHHITKIQRRSDMVMCTVH